MLDQLNNQWHHLVTMDFPVEGVRFSSSTGSFIEDWLGNGNNQREVHHRNRWKRGNTSHIWRAFESARFERVSPDAGAANYIKNYDGGVEEEEYYFMKSGGNSSPVTHQSGATLILENNRRSPEFDTIQIYSFDYSQNPESIDFIWTNTKSGAPQFSYSLNVFSVDNPEESILTYTSLVPHQRDFSINLSELPNGSYRFEFYLTDIFDKKSEIESGDFLVGTTGMQNGEINIRLNQSAELSAFDFQIIGLSGKILKTGKLMESISLSGIPNQFIVIVINRKSQTKIHQKIFSNFCP